MKRRKPWVAFLLTQLCPGLGQLYNGDLRWTAISFVASFLVALGSTIWLFDTLGKLLFAVALGLLVDTILSVQAYLRAKRIGAMELRAYQRWWVYLLFTLVLYGVPDGYGLLMPSRIRSFQIPSESMVPNLLVGDRLVADGWAYWHADPQRGDIVVFDYPRDPAIKFVKRLVGLPGDKVELKRGELYLNGQLVPSRRSESPILRQDGWQVTEYLETLGTVTHTLQRSQPENDGDFGPVEVPPGKFFMMGDNRDRSSDSRVWGFVSRDQLIGRMAYVYFSWDSDAYHKMRAENPRDLGAALLAGTRWSRIGMPVH
jgi:signal peptidase I